MIILLHLADILYNARLPLMDWYLSNIDFFRAHASRSPW